MPGCELTGTPAVFNAHPVPHPARSPEFTLSFARLQEAVGVNTLQALAELFRVRLSFVSDVKRRERIPTTWLYHLLLTRRVSPHWILYGTEPKDLAFADMGSESITGLLLERGSH